MLNLTSQKRRASTKDLWKHSLHAHLVLVHTPVLAKDWSAESTFQSPQIQTSTLCRWAACGSLSSPSLQRDINYYTSGANNLHAQLLGVPNLTESQGGKRRMYEGKPVPRGRENMTENKQQNASEAPTTQGPLHIWMTGTKWKTTQGNKKASVGKRGQWNYRKFWSGAALEPGSSRPPPQESIASAPAHKRTCAQCAFPRAAATQSCLWFLQVNTSENQQNQASRRALSSFMSTGQSRSWADLNHHGGDYVLSFFLPLPSIYSWLLKPESLTSPFMRFLPLPPSLPPSPLHPSDLIFFSGALSRTMCWGLLACSQRSNQNSAQTLPRLSVLILSLINTPSHVSWSLFLSCFVYLNASQREDHHGASVEDKEDTEDNCQ